MHIVRVCSNQDDMKLDAPSLINRIVELEVLSEDHRSVLRESGAIEAMWSWMPVIATGTNFESYFDHILALAKRGDFIPFAIWCRRDREFAGVAAFLDINLTHRRLRVGYVWHPVHMRGTAIHPATQLALIERALAVRIRRIELHAAETNERAIRAAERLGAKREGMLRNYLRVADGRWSNMIVFSLIDEEAKAAISMLRDRISTLEDARPV